MSEQTNVVASNEAIVEANQNDSKSQETNQTVQDTTVQDDSNHDEDDILDDEIDDILKDQNKENQETSANKPKKNRVQKRINALTKKNYELQGQLAAYKEMGITPNKVYETQSNELPIEAQIPKPNRDDYNSEEDYFSAIYDYKQQTQELKKRIQEDAIRQQQEHKTWKERIDIARKEYHDYDDVIEEGGKEYIHPAAGRAMISSEYGAEIRYYLAKNPELTRKTLNMNDNEAIRFIGRLEARIEQDKQAKKQKLPVSKAPEPFQKQIKTSSGSGNIGKFDPYDPKVDMKTYFLNRSKKIK